MDGNGDGFESRDIRVLETAEDIQARREQVLNKYEETQKTAELRHRKLLEAREYQYWHRDTDELEAWIREQIHSLEIAANASYLGEESSSNMQARLKKHEILMNEVNCREEELIKFDKQSIDIGDRAPYLQQNLETRMNTLKELWELLKQQLLEREHLLKSAMQYVNWVREVEDFLRWINEKEDSFNELEAKLNTSSLEQVPHWNRKIELIVKEVENKKYQLDALFAESDEIVKVNAIYDDRVQAKQLEIREAWISLNDLSTKRQRRMFDSRYVQKAAKDIDDIMEWMNEKKKIFNATELPDVDKSDLATIQGQQRRHEVMERDLSSMFEKCGKLGDEVDRANQTVDGEKTTEGRERSEQCKQLGEKLQNLDNLMNEFKGSADERKKMLNDIFNYIKFKNDTYNTTMRYNGMLRNMEQDTESENKRNDLDVMDDEYKDLVLDIVTVEMQIERHCENRSALNNQKELADEIINDGEKMIENDHFKSEEIRDDLDKFKEIMDNCERVWAEKEAIYSTNMDAAFRVKDFESMEAFLRKHEGALQSKNYGNTLEQCEIFIRKHEEIEKWIEQSHQTMEKKKEEFMGNEPYYLGKYIENRFHLVFANFGRIVELAKVRGERLKEQRKLHLFEKDNEELLAWLREKLAYAKSDERITSDGQNLQVKIQKYQNVEAEFNASESHYESLKKDGIEMIEGKHFASELIEKQLSVVDDTWDKLKLAMEKRSKRLSDAITNRSINRSMEDVEIWIRETEAQLKAEDTGRDLKGVQALIKRVNAISEEVEAYGSMIKTLNDRCQSAIDDHHYDSENLERRRKDLNERYKRLSVPLEKRHKLLDEAKDLHQLYRNIETEEAWIRQKHPLILGPLLRGRNLSTLNNFRTRHIQFQNELSSHEPKYREVENAAMDMINENHWGKDDIKYRINHLEEEMDILKRNALGRRHDLDCAISEREYMNEADESETWINEKMPLVSSGDCGRDEDSATALLRKHVALMNDIEAFSKRINMLEEEAKRYQTLKNRYNNCTISSAPLKRKEQYVMCKGVFDAKQTRELSMKNGQRGILLYEINAEWWNIESDGCEGFVPSEYLHILTSAEIEKEENMRKEEEKCVETKQNELESNYKKLAELAEERKEKLQQACDTHKLVREAADLLMWMDDHGKMMSEVDNQNRMMKKESEQLQQTQQPSIVVEDGEEIDYSEEKTRVPDDSPLPSTIIEECEDDVKNKQKQFDDFKKDLKVTESRIQELNVLYGTLIKTGRQEEADIVGETMGKMNVKWNDLKKEADSREAELKSAHEVQHFMRDCNETIEWALEKKQRLDTSNQTEDISGLPVDLASAQRARRRHDGFERDLRALGARVKNLDMECDTLIRRHPEQRQAIEGRQEELDKIWIELTKGSDVRKIKLIDVEQYQQFNADLHDLSSWMESMLQQVKSKEVGNDVGSSEALLSRHQEYRVEIDSRNAVINKLLDIGQQLLDKEHYESEQIMEKMKQFREMREEVLDEWNKRREILDQSAEAHMFLREVETANQWMRGRENQLNAAETPMGVEAAIKRHEDFDRAINVQEKKIESLKAFYDSLVSKPNPDVGECRSAMEGVMRRWEDLKKKMLEKRAQLGESQTLQDFSRDADEIEMWLTERIHQISGDITSRNLVDVASKQQKQNAFEAELAANSERVKAIIDVGKRLKAAEKCAGLEDEVEKRVYSIKEQWEVLLQRSTERTYRLRDIARQQSLHAGIKDIEFWLGEIEQQMKSSSDDFGRDLTSVKGLLKKHQLLQNDIISHDESVKNLNATAECFINQIDEDNNRTKEKELEAEKLRRAINSISDRYEKVKIEATEAYKRLSEANQLHQFLRDLNEEEQWIKEKEIRLRSNEDTGRDLAATENLYKKHRRLITEIKRHETGEIEQLKKAAEEDNISSSEIAKALNAKERFDDVMNQWNRLVLELTMNRTNRLEDALHYQQWSSQMNEELTWIGEKKHIQAAELSDETHGTGDSLATVQGLLKKLDAFRTDFQLHKDRCGELETSGNVLIESNNENKQLVQETVEKVNIDLEQLLVQANSKQIKLQENAEFLEFLWRADVVENWIAEKELHVRADDIDSLKTLLSLENALSRQNVFEASLVAFLNDGIAQLDTLRKQLMKGDGHSQLPAIKKRHEEVMLRWERLCDSSADRKQRLIDRQRELKQIEQLFLDFARKASSFNTWFENAEEDLTDPVRCNSIDEINTLIDVHKTFKDSLDDAKLDLNELEKLDERVKQLNMGPNPYTWFTMETLKDTWKSLERAVEERDQELELENTRQIENDQYRRKFAEYANAFHSWLTETRQKISMTNIDRTLEEEKNMITALSKEIREQRAQLKEIEDLGCRLESRLVLDNRYTEHSVLSLVQAWDQLDQLSRRMQYNLDQQIQAKKKSGVSNETYREFGIMFKHFDKDNDGALDHTEFRACLLALAYELPMAEENQTDTAFNDIIRTVDPQGTGHIHFKDYMEFMVSRETENVSGMDDVLGAFMALTESGERKEYITKTELIQNLVPHQAEFCIENMQPFKDQSGNVIPDSLDYVEFTRSLFTHS